MLNSSSRPTLPDLAAPPPRPEPVRPSFFRLDFIVRPPFWGRATSTLVIVTLLIVIGLADHLTGPNLSLRVFYDIPVALAVIWLGGWAGVVTCAAVISVLYYAAWLENAPYAQAPQIWWNLPVGFVSYLVVAWFLHALVVLRRQLELRVQQRTAALEREVTARAQLQREQITISERERGSIGHDLHDGLCQHLVGTAFAAQVLAGQLAARGEPAADEARNIVRLLEEGITQIRHLARGLLLADIKPERLTAELEELAVSVSRASGTSCRLVVRGDPRAADGQTASHLFYIAQEAVRNALRHAQPHSLEIAFTAHPHHLTLAIADDGIGLPANRTGGGMGLRIMADRAKIIGATLAVEPAGGGGTLVHCRVPATG